MHTTWLGLWAAGFLTRTQRLRLVAHGMERRGGQPHGTERMRIDGRSAEQNRINPVGTPSDAIDPDEAVRGLWSDARRRPRKWGKFDSAQELLNHAHAAHERLRRALEAGPHPLRVVETSTLGVHSRSPYLCVAGALPPPHGALGIVGTRAISQSDAAKITQWIYPLVSQCNAVISGGAHGVDTIAHRVAVELKVPTWVVFASGLLHTSPRSNLALFEECLEGGGGWVSEKAPWYTPFANDFLERNTVIAGLSNAVLVARAPSRSGALSTARAAQAQGKPVLAFPGNPDDENAEGCHHLLRRGATWADLQTRLAPILNSDGQMSMLDMRGDVRPEPTELWTRPHWGEEEERLLKAFAAWRADGAQSWMFDCATQHQEAVLDLELGGWAERDAAGQITWSERGALAEKLLQTEAKKDISC